MLALVALIGCAATAGRAEVLRVFTADDIAPTVMAPPIVPGAMRGLKVTPLFAGSDKTAFKISLTPTGDTALISLFDIPVPANWRSGTRLIGHVAVPRNGGVMLPDGSSEYRGVNVELWTTSQDGKSRAIATARLADAPGVNPAMVFSLPINFGPDDRPTRLAGKVLMPRSSYYGYGEVAVAFDGLAFTSGSGPATTPTAAATNQLSPAWPPSGSVEHTLHSFGGNDFFPYLYSFGPSDVDAPVTFSVNPNGEPIISFAYASPLGPRTVPVLSYDVTDAVPSPLAVVGQVGYGGLDDAASLDGLGYFELQSDFADGTHSVTRTLASSGPQRVLSGRSGDRPFALPIDTRGRRLTHLQLNLVMNGAGQISLTNLMLDTAEAAPATRPALAAASLAAPPWWARPRATELGIGGVGLIGLLGLIEPLVRRGRGRRVLLGGVVCVAMLGQIYFAWAMALLGRGEPPRAWWTLLLCAAACWCVPLSVPILNRRYREAELRKMRVLDVASV